MYRQTIMPEGISREQFTQDTQIRQIKDDTEVVLASSSSYNTTEVTI